MWQLGFLPHKVAAGLLSILLPLYVVGCGGSLLDVGLMTSVALLLAIPASLLWGYVCDKTKRYKRYILTSFLTSSAILYLLTLVTGIVHLMALYVVLAILQTAYETPKNVLIAELYSREEWEESYATFEGLSETGWLIGLVLGALTSYIGFNARTMLLLCSSLNLSAFLLSLLLVADPPLVLERSLVRIERGVDLAFRGITIVSNVLGGFTVHEKLEKENLYVFYSGLLLFSLATSILFTPLPIFLSKSLNLPMDTVFGVYALNSSAVIIGYLLTGNPLELREEEIRIGEATLLRSLLTFSLAILIALGIYSLALIAPILALMGFTYALYRVYVLSLSMVLIPPKEAGLFNALLGLGSAGGAFLGPFIAQSFGFSYLFLLAGVFFTLAYVAFKLFS
ncbi:MAG: MFS transporter [Candidatus Nezhaarchaeales archaeon]